jgi:hypothetical protein
MAYELPDGKLGHRICDRNYYDDGIIGVGSGRRVNVCLAEEV